MAAALLRAVAAGSLLLATLCEAEEPYTPKHEAGRCAMRGHCGKQSFFGSELPCVDNGLATEPDDGLREKLVGICGPKWSSGAVCCTEEQVDALKDNFATANQLIASCPACKENFYNLFCTFSCSPDQSLFVNITDSVPKGLKTLVTELDQLVSAEYGTGFYDSCKDVKFGPTNSRAMDLIGGGAKNYSELLAFLGKKRFGGSPFQMNFPREYSEPDMAPRTMKPESCSGSNFRCACVDCPAVCPELVDVAPAQSCSIGSYNCLSAGAFIVFFAALVVSVAGFRVKRSWDSYVSNRRGESNLLVNPADDDDDDDDSDDGEDQAPYKVNHWCQEVFFNLGHFAARWPFTTIGGAFLFVLVLSLGFLRFDIETDPARLWVSPTSDAAQEKEFFDTNFGPFYRAEKVFLVNDTLPTGPGPVLSHETLRWWMGVEEDIRKLRGPESGATLESVCFKPTKSACVVQSVTAYFENQPLDKNWEATLKHCAQTPVDCRPAYGQPLEPEMILGGYPGPAHVVDASAMTVTWVVNNYAERSPELQQAMDWEKALKARLLSLQDEAADRGLRLSFSTEMSLEEELNKSTNTDAKIIVISYIVMFLYASVALASTTLSLRDVFRRFGVAAVQSKFGLGLAGIVIVIFSVVSSIGLFSWAGLKATLIIVDVIPFIVLAVGVDNIFLIVHEFERANASYPDDQVQWRVARALARMGPSILFSAITETICFALGAFVGMPAVRNFAIYAAGAVLINAILQVTMFISVLSLNQIRVENFKADILVWVTVDSARVHLTNSPSGQGAGYDGAPHEGVFQRFIRAHYAPVLLKKATKVVVWVLFGLLFTCCVALLPAVQLGLDQRVAIPDDSYLIPYFNDLYDYFDSGPPVYFVTKGLNATQRKHQQEICARFTTCMPASLPGVLEQERKRTNVSYIASPAASWIDDFFLWLNPDFEQCCVKNGRPCFADRHVPWNVTLHGMPEAREFVDYLQMFVSSPTSEECPLGGQASYGRAVVIDSENVAVPASHFRTMHSPLRSQDDFIKAYASARRIASQIQESTGAEVFPYSVFYVFFDQYATIIRLTAALLGSAVAIIFAASWALLGSPMTAAVVAVTVVVTVLDIIGAMAVMGVSLNAVSLVNLIICVGISVEFCAHIARAFTFPSRELLTEAAKRFARDRDQRAWTALVNVGASVVSGITLTKIVGVFVLAFTRSKIFEIYYFRIWVALVVLAATHALIVLPVLLSTFGGRSYVDAPSSAATSDELRRAPSDSEQDSGATQDPNEDECTSMNLTQAVPIDIIEPSDEEKRKHSYHKVTAALKRSRLASEPARLNSVEEDDSDEDISTKARGEGTKRPPSPASTSAFPRLALVESETAPPEFFSPTAERKQSSGWRSRVKEREKASRGSDDEEEYVDEEGRPHGRTPRLG